MTARNHTRHLRAAVLVTLLAFGGYLLLLGGFDPQSAFSALGSIGPGIWAAILALSLFNYALRWARWHWLLLDAGHSVPAGRSLIMYIAGFAFTATPAKAGEAARAAYLHGEGVPVSRTISLLYLERVLDLFAVAILAVGAVGLWTGSVVEALILLLAFCLLLGMLCNRRIVSAVRMRLHPEKGRIRAWLNELLHAIETLLRVRVLAGGLVLGIVAWGAEGIGLALILIALNAAVSPEVAIGIYAVGMLAGAISMLPGGLGGAEAAMIAALLQTGAGGVTASVATVICRVATLWFAVGLGALAVLGLSTMPPGPKQGSETP